MCPIISYINDILTAISDVESFTKDMSFESFEKDKKTINAVIRSLEILGEATKRIPKPLRQLNPRHTVESNGRHARYSDS